jgi:hypothetical protein
MWISSENGERLLKRIRQFSGRRSSGGCSLQPDFGVAISSSARMTASGRTRAFANVSYLGGRRERQVSSEAI